MDAGRYGFFEPPKEDAAKLPQPPTRRGPAFGALDGVRKDIQAAKDAGVAYDPRGAGAAWNHNFLNKKPWHPLTFRNMARVWEVEQKNYEKEKKRAEAAAEFQAEQEYLKTISLLSEEEQRKYRERQSVSFLYMKPPGYDAALERAERDKAASAAAGNSSAAGAAGAGAAAGQPPGGAAGAQQQQQQQQQEEQAGGGQGQQRRQQQNAGGHLKNVLGGIKAVAQQHQQGLELKHVPTAGRSPPRGGATLDAPNQQFVVAELDSDEEEEAIRLALMPESERRRLAKEARRQQRQAALQAKQAVRSAKEAEIEQAKAVLRAAGLTLPGDSSSSGSSSNEGDSSGGSDGGSDEEEGEGRRQQKRHSKSNRGSSSRNKRRSERGSNKHHRKHKKRRHKERD